MIKDGDVIDVRAHVSGPTSFAAPEALRRIQRDPNRARLKKAIEGLDDVNIGGFRVHFADDRVASKVVELSLIDSQGKVRE